MADSVISVLTMLLGLAAGHRLARYFEDYRLERHGKPHDLRR